MLSAAEQTMNSWISRIKSYQEVPDVFKDTFNTLPFDKNDFPYTLLAPSYEGFMFRAKPKLVSCFGDAVYVIEEVKKDIACTCYPFKDINYVEVGSVLLSAWVKISGITRTGLNSSIFVFNTTTLPFLTPSSKR